MTAGVSASPFDLDAGEQTTLRVVASPEPHLSWRLPADIGEQRGYELEAQVGGQVVSARADSAQRRMVAWPWGSLPSRSRVQWRVRVHGAEVWSDWSAWSAFEAPLFEADDWSAIWISPAEEEILEDRPGYVLRTQFHLDVLPRESRLYASALGVYEAVLNGRRLGDIELAPGSSNYDETVYAQAYDATPALRAGLNTIEIVLSDGWFLGRNGGGQRQNAWGDRTAAIAQLEVLADDDWHVVTGTDSTWTSHIESITRADLMTGQSTDYSCSPSAPAPVRAGVVHPHAPKWSPAPPPQRIEERSPVTMSQIAPGVSVIDFGQNLSGWVRLTDLGEDGAETVLEFGEHLDAAGDLTTTHLDIVTPEGHRIPYRQIDRVTAGPAGSVFEPRHTVHGFQYVRIQHPGRSLDPSSVTAVVVHSALTQTSWFECSDPQLNRLHEIARWSFLGNVVDVPTDCPTRERSGWTGDFQVFAPTAALLYDIDGFSRKWLQAVRDDQYDDGSLAMFSPDSERMKHNLDNPSRVGGGSAGWGDAAVYVPWTLYETYGDIPALHDSWDSMTAWVQFALRIAREHRHPTRSARSAHPAPHEQYVWDASFHFGEWLEPTTRSADATPPDPAAEYMAFLTADKGEIATAYLYRSASILSRIAFILEKHGDADRYAELAESIRSAWQTEFLSDNGRIVQDTQAAYVRALAFDLIPPDLVDTAASRLVELIEKAGGHLTTGFLSTGLLLPVLADHGHADVAYELLLRHGTPSWLGMLDRGATTVWEDWDGIDEDGKATASLNHYSKGAVIRFLYTHLVGLRQSVGSTAWQSLEIRPVLGGGITSAAARYLSPQGLIDVRWALADTGFDIAVTVPAGSTAVATLPDGSVTALAPGSHRLSCALPADSTHDVTRRDAGRLGVDHE